MEQFVADHLNQVASYCCAPQFYFYIFVYLQLHKPADVSKTLSFCFL